MTKLLNIPIPLAGLNTINPFVAIDSGFARELTNYAIINGKLRVRPAVRNHIAYNAAITGPYNHLYATDVPVISGITTAGVIYTNIATATTPGNIGGACQAPATYCKHISLDLVIGCRAPRNRAQPFTAWGFTPIAGITDTTIIAACSHKGRLYYTDGTTIQYSQLGQITGAVTVATDGGSITPADFLDGQSVLRIFSMTINPGNGSENVFIIFGSAGKVLIYSGDYPRAANWNLIGNYNMPPPLNLAAFQEVDGDIFIASKLYPYWASSLISGNIQTAYFDSPAAGRIENLWQAYATYTAVAATNNEATSVFYLDKVSSVSLDAIVIRMSSFVDLAGSYGGNSINLVYFRKYKAWALWVQAPFKYGIAANSTDYYAGGYPSGAASEVNKLDFTSMVDQLSASGGLTSVDIETSWKTPYASVFDGVYQALQNVRVFFSNSVSGYMEKVRAIFDFSDFNAPYGFYTQSSITQVNPGNYTEGAYDLAADASNQYQPFLGIGGAGINVSFQMTQKAKSGSSATQTQEINAVSAVISDGGTQV